MYYLYTEFYRVNSEQSLHLPQTRLFTAPSECTSLARSQASHSATGETLLLLLCYRRNRLHKVEVAFGVGEILDLLDLEAAVFVGNDVGDGDRFAGRLHPKYSRYLVGKL